MSPFEHVLAVWKDPVARREPIERAAGREPLLLQLGRLYHQRYLASPGSAGQPADWQVRDLEIQIGMRASADSDPPKEGGWLEHVVTGLVDVADARPTPEAVLVLGQSGAGKGVVAEELCQFFLPRGGCVAVDRYDLQYLHPRYSGLMDQDDRAASRAVFSDVVDLVEALYHRALASKKNLVLDGSLLDAASASSAVRELHENGYRMSVLVLCVPPGISWRATQERRENQQRRMGVGRWVGAESHEESCQELLTSLRVLEEQGLADEIHLFTREGDSLFSSYRERGHALGGSERVIRACWKREEAPEGGVSQGTPSSVPPPSTPAPAVITAGGRKVKVGSFRKGTAEGTVQGEAGHTVSGSTLSTPRERKPPPAGPKGIKLGGFAPPASGTAPSTKDPSSEKPPDPNQESVPPSPRPGEAAAAQVQQPNHSAHAPEKRQYSEAEERAIKRRRMLQAKIRSKVKPREDKV
jgi:ABC-type oligopeptide transport system ATPase subunit